MDIIYSTIGLILVLIISYWFLTKNFDHWKKQNVPSMPNPVPGFGHMLPVIFLKENVAALTHRIYKQTNASMIGFFFLQRPGIVIREPELVKSVLQTNFSSFRNNILQVSEKADPVMSKNPFFTEDYHLWKTARARTTAHLSGKKLRYMFAIIQEVCKKMSDYTDRKIKENGGTFDCAMKEFFVRCTGEVVANAAFAVEGQSFEDNPEKMSFTRVAKNMLEPTFINGMKQALLFYLPSLASIFEISFLEKQSENYFKHTARSIIEQRKQAKIAPNDYLQFCMDLNGDDMDSIVADLIIFYGDVYETSSTTMAIIFFYLSQNKEVQEKLRSEILNSIESTDGKLTYETLKVMNYLDQVMYESSRLLMPLGALMKVCTEEITLEGSDGLKCHLKPGDPVFISTHGMNLDSKYWPDPKVFDPERFSPENQAKRHKYVFLPFGEGPRMCIGMRFGIMLVKLVVSHMLTKYSLEYSSKTIEPLEMEPTTFMTHIKGGLWIKFKKLDS